MAEPVANEALWMWMLRLDYISCALTIASILLVGRRRNDV
jgi:hypothetical protein